MCQKSTKSFYAGVASSRAPLFTELGKARSMLESSDINVLSTFKAKAAYYIGTAKCFTIMFTYVSFTKCTIFTKRYKQPSAVSSTCSKLTLPCPHPLSFLLSFLASVMLKLFYLISFQSNHVE